MASQIVTDKLPMRHKPPDKDVSRRKLQVTVLFVEQGISVHIDTFLGEVAR
jgi:hypothetical protein